ncbi:unnamed protein product [Durusdinium trenchii]|uniref:Transmembrane protein n=1 Tax=Durusdinium trenchii TaxID=1381693 RepID=A0ABP0S9E9_9DINO
MAEDSRAVRCNAWCTLICGALAALLAAYACLEPVTALFVPEVGWFLLVPSLLILLLGLISCVSSGRSKLFQAGRCVARTNSTRWARRDRTITWSESHESHESHDE